MSAPGRAMSKVSGMARLLAVTAGALLAGGCVMIPDYQRPQTVHVPDTWPDGPAYPQYAAQTSTPPTRVPGWREFFTSARLQALIARALDNNPDVRLAALKVERLRAQYQLQQAKRLPQIDASGSYTRQSGSRDRTVAAGNRRRGSGAFDYYQVGVGITAYELDLFGRIRSLEQSALQQYLATIQARRSAKLALVAQVANAYLQWIASDAQLALAGKTLEGRERALSLVQKRFDAGIATGLDLRQAQTAYQSARVAHTQLRRSAARSRNALVALVGGGVPETPPEAASLKKPVTIDLPYPGLPSTLLLRRPDVIAAEHELKAANARIGAARAAFFPRITLTGSYGSISPELDGLFESGTSIWSFMPKISIPIFDGGRNQANLEVAQVSKRIEVAEYRKTIRTAFREVADTLAARGTLTEELAARRKLVEAALASYELSRMRYRYGVASYLPVLDAQRTLFEARSALIDTRLARLANKVTLYKVLGGGWRAHARDRSEEEAAAPASNG